MKKIYLLLIVVLSVFLTSCSNTVKYDNVDDLLKDYDETANRFNEKGQNIKTNLIVVGRYGDGYLMVGNYVSIHFPKETYSSTTINGIEIFHTESAEFYYYINYQYKEDCIIDGLENIYNQGFLTDEDLLNIQYKFNEWKDEEYPYSIKEHYPIN